MSQSLVTYWFVYFLKQHGIKRTIKGILGYLKWQLKKIKYDFSKEHEVKVNGCDLSLIPNDSGISEELLLFKTHEPFSTQVLTSNLQKGMVCLDIGGNLGYYATLESRKVGRTGKVIAIEPAPINFKYLTKNLSKQNESNFDAFNLAIGDVDGEISFFISEHSNASHVIREKELSKVDPKNVIKVPIKTIDSLVDELGVDKIDFLRMDAEGYEVHILEGATKTIQKFKPMIQIEVHVERLGQEKTQKLLENFIEAGYDESFCIPRELDTSIVGNESDMKKTNLNTLINDLEKSVLPRCMILLLKKPEI